MNFPLSPSRKAIIVLGLSLLGGFAAQAAPGEKIRVIVAFKPGHGAAIEQAVIASQGKVKLRIHGMDAVAVEVSEHALAGLERNPNVEYVEEDVKRHPLAGTTPSTGSPYLGGQLVPYGIKMVQADQLPDTYAANRKVCIIDSGYAKGHDDLSVGANITGDNDPGTGDWFTDENHHGTHVAGTISALNNSGIGVVGVTSNNQLKLHIIKVFGADAWAYSSTLASAANKCGTAGANVISMSLGGSFSSRTEQKAFDTLYTSGNGGKGVLSIAAAGNDGNTRVSYPAGYASVVSVAAIDESKAWATFSQYNKDVEIAAPGVNVLSTVPSGAGSVSSLTVNATAFEVSGMDGSPKATASGTLRDFGLGDTIIYGGMNGSVCLIQRGTIEFGLKVKNCEDSGGVGAIIYNNVAGSFGGTTGTYLTTIPSVTASDNVGTTLKSFFNGTATVAVSPSNYAFFDGTSMATPHVSAVAALVWSYYSTCTAAQIRTTLNNSAENLGAAGRDTKFGYGLVQAKAAYDRAQRLGCGK
jgi:subtilisin family serine protease